MPVRHFLPSRLLLPCLAATLAACTLIAEVAPTPTRAIGEANSPLSDYNLSEAADGQLRVWARSQANFVAARILESRRGPGGWSEPRELPFTDSRWRDSDPWLTPDGHTLYFISDRPLPARPDGHDLNIWRVSRGAEGWGKPEPLGDEVNSSAEELGPELHGGRLYFGSNRPGGLGGLDLYVAEQRGAGFAPAQALPAPINSAASEGDPTFSPDGRTLVFWRLADRLLVLHRAERSGSGWAEPVALPERFTFGAMQITPAFSPDGHSLRFASTPSAGPAALFDLYEAAWP